MALRIITSRYTAHAEAIFAIRRAVFVHEQQVPLELEIDERDAECWHVLAMDADAPIATGRLDVAYEGKIGRVAVLKAYRQQGIGRQVMLRLEQVAQQQQLPSVWLHAQVSALAFYQKLHYAEWGELFTEAGILHQAMHKHLR